MSIPDTDYFVLESTYGGKIRDKEKKNFDNRIQELSKIIVQIINNKGKLIIPAFSIHRTQQILFDIHYVFKKLRDEKYKLFSNKNILKKFIMENSSQITNNTVAEMF